jgi:hypothetical protein
VLRRTGRAAAAHHLLIGAADDIRPGSNAAPAQLSMYVRYGPVEPGPVDHTHPLATGPGPAPGLLPRPTPHPPPGTAPPGTPP